jgi:glycosyltransferase involved in cell wall biosynthesis
MGLKFGFFTTFFPPYHFGGDAIGVERLVRALARRGHEVTVVHDADAYRTLRGPEPASPFPDTDNIEIVTLRSPAPFIANLLTQQTGYNIAHGRRLERVIDEGRYDVLWHNNVSLVGGHGLLRRGRALKVYEAHEHWLVCPTHVLWRYNRELCDSKRCVSCQLSNGRPPQLWRNSADFRRSLDAVDLFIAKSRFSKEKHAEFGFARDMQVIPYFLPAAAAAPAPSERPQTRPFFLFVGRLEKIKGLQDIIPRFAGEGPADLVIIGAGEYEAELKALGAAHSRVKFLGRKPPEELAQWYAHAQALIVPSICFETFGIIIIEAFRQGTPVIARRLGPFPEIIDACGGGMLFSDMAELDAALSRIADDASLRLTMSCKAREGFAHNWTEEVVVEQYFDALARAAHKKGDVALSRKLEAA